MEGQETMRRLGQNVFIVDQNLKLLGITVEYGRLKNRRAYKWLELQNF